VEKLDWKRQKARCAFMLMVFVPLRMIAIWRLDPTTETPTHSEGVVQVLTRDKTDTKRSRSAVLIRTLSDKRLCPLYHYRLLAEGARLRGATGTLFCTDAGRAYATDDVVRHGVADEIHRQGVPSFYPGNSARHSTINSCVAFMKEHEVNAFTHHSQNSHTVMNFYYHLNQNWAGAKLSQLTGSGPRVVPVPAETQALMELDDAATEALEVDDGSKAIPDASQLPLASRATSADAAAPRSSSLQNIDGQNPSPREIPT
jgi:hypothetical protein